MKMLLRSCLVISLAVSALLASRALAGDVVINANASGYNSQYDSMNITVPAGAHVSYYWYIITTGQTQVVINGPGVSINDSEYSPGSNGGGAAFSGAGGVTGSVYAATSGGTAVCSADVGW